MSKIKYWQIMGTFGFMQINILFSNKKDLQNAIKIYESSLSTWDSLCIIEYDSNMNVLNIKKIGGTKWKMR